MNPNRSILQGEKFRSALSNAITELGFAQKIGIQGNFKAVENICISESDNIESIPFSGFGQYEVKDSFGGELTVPKNFNGYFKITDVQRGEISILSFSLSE